MAKSRLWTGPLLPLIFLFFFYFLWSANLVRFTLQAVDYDPRQELGLFHSESAFDYRYARLVAMGKPIPDFDPAAQWPEGLMTRQVIDTLMDQAAGVIYRAMIPPTTPFHLYIIYFVAYFSTLTIFPLFFLTWKLSQKPWLAFLASAAYTMTYATFGRSLGGYLHENFALPFLFLFLGSFYWAVSSSYSSDNYSWIKRGAWLLLAGGSLFIALASWHLSQFFFTAFTVSLLLAALWYWKMIKDLDGAKNLIRSFFALYPFLILAGLALPTLRYQGFLLSPTLLFCLSFLALWWAWKVKGQAKFIMVGLILAGTGVGLFFSSRHWGEYSHVYDLLFYKLRFFGQKPAEPARLSYEARVFWTAGFDTPTLKDLVLHYNLLLPFGLGGLVLYLTQNWKKKPGPPIFGLALLTLIFFLLSLLFLRMGVFLAFFLALFVPYWWEKAEGLNLTSLPGREKILKGVGTFSLVAILGFQLFFAVAFKFDKQTPQERLLLPWIIRHTAPPAVFLTPFEAGSLILTYTGRPVVLHSMFEERGIREKNRNFLEALYSTEEDFYRYCRQVKADYLLYQSPMLLDTSRDSNRYVAAKMKLIPAAAVFRLHFQENQLKHFQLVFQDGPFRLYKILDPEQFKGKVEGPAAPTAILYSPLFNPVFFDLAADSPGIETAQINRGLKKIEEFQGQIKLADDFLRKKIYNTSLSHLALAERMDPQSPVPHYLRAHLYLLQNQKEPAKAELKRALEKNPQYIYAQDLLSKIPW